MKISTCFIKTMTVLSFVLACCLHFTACKKGTEQETNHPTEPITTGKGVAIGAPATQMIGVAGGTLTSPDGKVKMTIPQGAVAVNTAFSIQPITNTLYEDDASRVAWRLLPEGTVFAKPVEIVFKYDDADLATTVEDFMIVTWQDANGHWKVEPARLNKQAKTLTVETTHFSDWTVTGGFELKMEKEVLKPTEKSKMWVVSVDEEDLLAPLSITAEMDGSLTALGNWKIIQGQGSLDAIKGGRKGFAYSALYTAPAAVNGRMNVVVTMEVEGFNKIKDPAAPGGVRQTGKMILFGRLIVSENFMTGTLGGIPFGFFGDEVVAIGLNNAMLIRGNDGSGEVTVTVSASGAGNYPCGQIILPGKAGINIGYSGGAWLGYAHSYFACGTGDLIYSPASVQIIKWPAVGQSAEGRFSGPVYTTDGTCSPQPKELEVQFNVVRSS